MLAINVHWTKFQSCEIYGKKIVIEASEFEISVLRSSSALVSNMQKAMDASVIYVPERRYFAKSRTYGADSLNSALTDPEFSVWSTVPNGMIELTISAAEMLNAVSLENIDEFVAAMYGCNYECA